MTSDTASTCSENPKWQQTLNDKCHANLWNLGFCPKGPSEEKDGGECFAPLTYIFFCAAARRQPLKVCQRTQERAPNAQKSKKLQPLKNTLQLNASQFWCSSEHLKAKSESSNDILKWCLPLSGLLMLIEITESSEMVNATQTWETLNFARRAPLKRKMEESASHHKFTFSFALLRADSLKKCANGHRREPKCTKIWKFAIFQKYTSV